jgi:hypothetical protein
MSVSDRLWDIGLLIVGGACAAFGLFSPNATSLWIVAGAVFLAIFVLRWQRDRIGRWLASYVIQYMPAPVAPSTPTTPDPAADRQHEALAAVRTVIEALAITMSRAADDRDHGRRESQHAAVEAAGRVAANVQLVPDEEAPPRA